MISQSIEMIDCACLKCRPWAVSTHSSHAVGGCLRPWLDAV